MAMSRTIAWYDWFPHRLNLTLTGAYHIISVTGYLQCWLRFVGCTSTRRAFDVAGTAVLCTAGNIGCPLLPVRGPAFSTTLGCYLRFMRFQSCRQTCSFSCVSVCRNFLLAAQHACTGLETGCFRWFYYVCHPTVACGADNTATRILYPSRVENNDIASAARNIHILNPTLVYLLTTLPAKPGFPDLT